MIRRLYFRLSCGSNSKVVDPSIVPPSLESTTSSKDLNFVLKTALPTTSSEDIKVHTPLEEPVNFDSDDDDLIQPVLLSVIDIPVDTCENPQNVPHNINEAQEVYNSSFSCCVCRSDDDPEDSITLTSCGHTLHLECAIGQLRAKWTGKSISFGYMTCGECRTPMTHPHLIAELESHNQLKKRVETLCVDKCREDGLMDTLLEEMKPPACPDIDTESPDHNSDQVDSAVVDRCVNFLSCFICNVCAEPFCGGRVDCAEDAALDVSSLCCPSCAFNAQKDVVEEGEGDSTAKAGWIGNLIALSTAEVLLKQN